MMAAREGHLPMVVLLLDHGADVNHKTKFGYTALEVARERGMRQIAEALVKAGAED
jgi:ankyrin repeat protein